MKQLITKKIKKWGEKKKKKESFFSIHLTWLSYTILHLEKNQPSYTFFHLFLVLFKTIRRSVFNQDRHCWM